MPTRRTAAKAALAVLILSAIADVLIYHRHAVAPRLKDAFARVPEPAIALLSGILLFLLVIILSRLALYLWSAPEQPSYYGLEPKDRLDLANALRSHRIQIIATVVQSLGGIAVLIGIWFAWANLKTTQEAQKATQDNQTKALAITNEGQITDRFTKAIDQLGSAQLELQLGGIYSLESIANESPQYHWPIMEVLTTYVRVHAPAKKLNERQSTERLPVAAPASTPQPDIQAVLLVLARRSRILEQGDGKRLNLSRTNLEGIQLVGADLEALDLNDSDFDGAALNGAHLEIANLSGALLNSAYLSSAKLSRARLNDAILSGADLSSANFEGATMVEIDLNGADLRGAHLEGADLTDADLRNANLNGTNFNGANLHLADFGRAFLGNADLKGAISA